MSYKIGERVILKECGSTYSIFTSNINTSNKQFAYFAVNYVLRYNPINVSLKIYGDYDKHKTITITSGYGTCNDLSCKYLRWKVRYIFYDAWKECEYIIISSNKNHMLVCNSNAISKL